MAAISTSLRAVSVAMLAKLPSSVVGPPVKFSVRLLFSPATPLAKVAALPERLASAARLTPAA